MRSLLMSTILSSRQKIVMPPAYRYWRIRIDANQSGGSTPAVSLGEVHLTEYPTGPNLATTSANASADSFINSTYAPSKALDNNTGTWWVTPNVNYGTHWWAYDFGAGNEQTIQSIQIWKRSDGFGANEALTEARVQRSDDGINWVTEWTISTPANWGGGAETRTFNRPDIVFPFVSTPEGAHHRYFLWDGAHEYPFMNEIEFRESIGGSSFLNTNNGANVTGGHPGQSGNVLANAYDGNTATYWQLQSTSPGASWIAWEGDYFDRKVLEEIRLRSISGASKDRMYMGMIFGANAETSNGEYVPYALFGYPTVIGKTDAVVTVDKDNVGVQGRIGDAYRYWEILCWGRGNRDDFFQGFRNLDLLASDLTTSLNKTLGGTATDNDGRFPASNPWNNINLETNNTAQMYWNRWDFGAANEQAVYALRVTAANNGSVTPVGALIRASNDLSNWVWYQWWGNNTWSNNQQRTYNFADVQSGPIYA